MMKRERRFLQSEVSVQAGEQPKISGYCAVFESKSEDLGGFREIIDAGAFDECLSKNPDVVGLINHDNNQVLGRTSSGTMRISKDATGIKYEIDPPATSFAKDLLVSMERKDIRASSFGFICRQDKWSVDRSSGETVRRLMKVDIFDASVVTNPAYLDATSQVRSLYPDDKGEVPEEIQTKITETRMAARKEKRGRSILSAVSGNVWAITPDKLETICGFLNNWSEGHAASKEEVQAAMMGYKDYDDYDVEDLSQDAPAKSPVAVIGMYGTIGQRMTMMTDFSGGCSCESLTKKFRTALADESITAIVFDVDSPGGTVTGVPELAAEIREARGKKPIIAVANGMAGSAAYWLASAADKFVVIPSGKVGSIGVYTVHQDVSAAMDKAGVKLTYIQAGKFKTEGNPYEAASDEFIASVQKDVDSYYEMFTQGVADGRGVSVEKVLAEFGQGRMLMAKDALAAGMVDEVATLDQVLAGLTVASETLQTELPFEEPVIDGTEASSVTDCGCDCSACMAGDHDDCETGDCEMEDDEEAAAEVPPVEAVISPEPESAEDIEANENARYKVKVLQLL